MRQNSEIDFTTLNWVKQELDETLKQARQALESYVEDTTDSSLMRFCATYLHQVQGTLRMVELYGAAMVVEEMESLASAILDGQVRNKDDAYGVLMRGIVQLPDYLERLQSGHKDVPIVLLPLLNDLRASRGEKLLSESVLFSPDLGAALPSSVSGPDKSLPDLELKAQSVRLRTKFQLDLLAWIRNDSNAQAIGGMISALDQLVGITAQVDGRRLWWIASGVLEALRDGTIENNTTIKSLIGKVDREMKHLADVGDNGFKVAPPKDLTKSLLYYIANSKGGSLRVKEIRQVYRLDQLLPSEAELEHARGSLAGRNRALLDTVSIAIKDDLMRVKDALDLHLRTQGAKAEDLAAQSEVLDRASDTLGMLGLGVPRRVVIEQRDALKEIVAGKRAADESSLLDIAGALLFVEASLDQNIQSLGAAEEPSTGTEVAHELPQAEIRKILEALIDESITNIRQVKQDMVAFVESPWDHAKADNVPRLLDEVSGAFTMLEMLAPSEFSNALARFTSNELITAHRVPTSEQMDRIADAVESLEYYLEAARDQRVGREKILDTTKRSLEALGYWPVPEFVAPAAVAPATPAPVSAPAPVAKPVVAPSENLELDALSFDTQISTRSEAFKSDLAESESPISGVTISEDNIDAFIERAGREQAESQTLESSLAPSSDAGVTMHEMDAVVDISPGGLDGLMFGETSTVAVQPPPPAHDVTGLVFAETGKASESLQVNDEPEFDWVEIEEEVEEWVEPEAAPVMAESSAFVEVPSDDIDDEIRETFVEEVGEEIENLNSNFPAWRAHLEDMEKLKPVRRSFHTLKGSGRLVGAKALGEFSWKVENMLNRVLDKTIPPNAAMQDLLDKAIGALPEMLTALKGEGNPTAPIAEIMTVADKLAAGEEAWVAGVAKPEPVLRKVLRKRMIQVPRPKPVVQQPVELTQSLNIEEPMLEEVEEPEFTSPVSIPYSEEAAGSGGVVPSIDPVMLEILRSEVDAHVQTLRGYLHHCEQQDAIVGLDEASVRAAHTLHGALAMAEVPGLSDTLGAFESYAKRLRSAGTPPTAQGFDAIARTVVLLESSMSNLGAAPLDMVEAVELTFTFEELGAHLPEPASDLQAFGLELDEEDALEAVAEDSFVEEVAALEAVDLAPEVETESSLESIDNGNLFEDDGFVAMEEPVLMQEEPGLAAVESDEDADAIAELDALLAAADAARFEPIADQGGFAAVESLNAEESLGSAEAPLSFDLDESVGLAEVESTESISVDSTDGLADDAFVEGATPAEPVFEFNFEEPIVETPTPIREVESVAVEDNRAVESAPRAAAIAPDPDPEGPLNLPDMDEELMEIFVQEGIEILDQADADVAALRADPGSANAINALQRHLHTVKGNARAVGLTGIGDLAHVMESLIEGVKEGRLSITGVAQDSIETGFDRLHRLVQRVSRRQDVGYPHHAIARFEQLARGETPELEGEVTEAPIAPVIESSELPIAALTPAPEITAPVEIPVATSKPAPRAPVTHLPKVEEEEVTRAPQEMIRVRSDLLDHLVNFAGEVSIYRSRLEQQMVTFRFNIVELEQTVLRVREQLRKLEMETEAQILSRFQREAQEAGGAAEFDPLELDRFSTLQQLSRALAESVSDLSSLQSALDDLTRQSETLLLQQSRVSSELQEGLMRTRMVPFDSLVPMLRRTLRQASVELGKQAQLKVEGAQGEMDRNLLERMKAPFEHMVRNALAHGIESPDEREAAGKPAEGNVKIAVSRDSTEVVIKVSDDGKGIDRDAIRRKAIERGLMRPDAHLSDRDLFSFILETGFSTAEQVTKVAGRGVGMDVVANEIKQLGGSLAIDSKKGAGTEFTIRLPFTLAVTQAILVKTGEAVYAVPMSSVQGVARITVDDYNKKAADPDSFFTYAGEDYHIHELSHLLGLPPHRMSEDQQLPLLLTRTGDQRAAIRIDSVIGAREIVVKSVGPQISSVPGIFGATITGDGSVVMILDLAPLVRRALALRAEAAAEEAVVETVVAVPVETRKPLVMVVDDSITMRKVTTRVLERNEMEVLTAKDGLDAVEKLYDKVPDLVLLDIEMPRMDGYEFATYMRNDARLKHVPIIMITSRTGDKHRQRAFEIGVDRYLGKPYQEADLLRNVEEALRISRAVH